MKPAFTAVLLFLASVGHAKDFDKSAVEFHAAPSRRAAQDNTPVTQSRKGTSQIELMQRQFPRGTTCSFKLTREQLLAMKPGELYVPAGNVVYCRQPFDSAPEARPLQI